MDYLRISPSKVYQTPNGDITPLRTAAVRVTVGTNREVIAALAGSRHRIMSIASAQSSTGVLSTLILRSGTPGGTILFTTLTLLANQTAYSLIPYDAGYFETNTGEGLFADATGTPVDLNISYITYIPT